MQYAITLFQHILNRIPETILVFVNSVIVVIIGIFAINLKDVNEVAQLFVSCGSIAVSIVTVVYVIRKLLNKSKTPNGD